MYTKIENCLHSLSCRFSAQYGTRTVYIKSFNRDKLNDSRKFLRSFPVRCMRIFCQMRRYSDHIRLPCFHSSLSCIFFHQPPETRVSNQFIESGRNQYFLRISRSVGSIQPLRLVYAEYTNGKRVKTDRPGKPNINGWNAFRFMILLFSYEINCENLPQIALNSHINWLMLQTPGAKV